MFGSFLLYHAAHMLWVFVLALSATSPPQEAYDELLTRGVELAQQQDWAGAEEALRSAARMRPRSTEPLLALAELYLIGGKPREALGPIDRALAIARGDFRALLLRGTALIQLGMFPEAVLELAAALEKRPGDEGCRKALAMASLRAGDPKTASEALAPIVEAGETTDASAYALYGAALVERERAAEAIAPLDEALRLEPGQAQALLYSGRALLALERFDEAAERFRQGTSFPPPQQVRYVLGLAEALVGLKRHDDAGTMLEELVARHPRAARAYFLLGLIAAESASYDDAAELFGKAIEHGHHAADAHLNLGIALAAIGDNAGAEAALDEALRVDEDLAAAYYYKGVLRFEDGATHEAIELLDRAAALEPNEPRTYLALTEAHLKLGQLIRASETADKAAAPSRLGGRGHYTKGLVHHERIEYPEAEAEYRRALRLGLDDTHVHLNLGRVLYAMARHEEADESVSRVLSREPENGDAHFLKGKIDLELRRYDSALEHLTRAAELQPETAEVWFRRGIAHSRQRDSAAAIADWRRALELDPELVDAYYRLGTELLKSGKADEGESVLAEFQRRSKAAEEASQREAKLRTTVRRAIELSGKRRDDEALALFEEALAIDPSAPLTYLALGEFYTLRGRAEDGERILLQGLAEAPEHVSLHEALLSLYEATGNDAMARETRKRLAALKGNR